ncbi:MAG: hypothetical protein ABW250_25495 [Pyrinomonadaceae bacterium]
MKTRLNYSPLVRFLLLSLVMLTASSGAAGQSNIYSDVYFDDSDAENGHGYVVGVGVTEEAYNSYSHEYLVTSTITANDGTSNVGYGMGTGTYAYGMAETAIEWTDVTAGSFIVATEHKIVCPYWNMEYWESFTYAEKYVDNGGSLEYHYIVDYPKLEPNRCAYDLCADQEHKACFWRMPGSEDHPANNPNADDRCYKYLTKGYVIVIDPIFNGNWCIRAYKTGSDNQPPGYCGY